jgi:hypothetical protein
MDTILEEMPGWTENEGSTVVSRCEIILSLTPLEVIRMKRDHG